MRSIGLVLFSGGLCSLITAIVAYNHGWHDGARATLRDVLRYESSPLAQRGDGARADTHHQA